MHTVTFDYVAERGGELLLGVHHRPRGLRLLRHRLPAAGLLPLHPGPHPNSSLLQVHWSSSIIRHQYFLTAASVGLKYFQERPHYNYEIFDTETLSLVST